MIENNIRFAENLKKLRNMWNESQKSLSAWAGVSEGNIYHWESGRTIPDVEMLGRIAAHFAVTVEQLLYYDFSDFEVAPLPSDKDRIIKTAVSFFYRVSTIEAQKNPDFQAGYKLDKQLWKDDQLTVEEFRLRIENVTSYYINALDSGIAEAACNIMCYLLIAWFSFTNPVVIEKFATIPNEPGMVRNLFKRIKQEDFSNEKPNEKTMWNLVEFWMNLK